MDRKTNNRQRPAGEAVGRRGPVGEAPGRRGPAGEAARRRGPAGEATGRRGPAGEAAGRREPAGEAARHRGPAREATGRRGPAGEAARCRGPAREASGRREPAGEAARRRAPAREATGRRGPASEAAGCREPVGEAADRCGPVGETAGRRGPVGEAAGRRGPPQRPPQRPPQPPPQSHHHQHKDGAWGNLEDEERHDFLMVIKDKTEYIKYLTELIKTKDRCSISGYNEEAERVGQLEKENHQLTLALQRQEEESKQRYEEMLAKYEASNHAIQSQVQSEYQQKEALMEKKIHQMNTDLLKMREEQHSLLLKLADTHAAAVQQSEEDWQEKYEALNKKMEENTTRCETQDKELTLKVSLMEEQIHQRDLEISRLTEDNVCLATKLAETEQELTKRAAELLQSQTAWEEKPQALNKKMENKTDRCETQEKEFNIKVSLMEEQIHQRDLEISRLTEDKDCLAKKLAETEQTLTCRPAELPQSQTAWEEKLQALKDNLNKEVEEKEQNWQLQQTEVSVKVEAEITKRDAEILRLTEDNASLLQQLSKTVEELGGCVGKLLQSQTACQDTNTALENITRHLAEKQLSWEREMAQLMDEKVELEDLCLYINSKRKRFLLFPRRLSDDRETLLQQLKTKMQQKAAKGARGAEKMEEEMEAADCSAQAGQQ